MPISLIIRTTLALGHHDRVNCYPILVQETPTGLVRVFNNAAVLILKKIPVKDSKRLKVEFAQSLPQPNYSVNAGH